MSNWYKKRRGCPHWYRFQLQHKNQGEEGQARRSRFDTEPAAALLCSGRTSPVFVSSYIESFQYYTKELLAQREKQGRSLGEVAGWGIRHLRDLLSDILYGERQISHYPRVSVSSYCSKLLQKSLALTEGRYVASKLVVLGFCSCESRAEPASKVTSFWQD